MRIIIIIAAVFAALNLQATSYTNSSTGGNWTSTSSWSPAGIPGAGDAVTLNSTKGSIIINTAVQCTSLLIGKNLTINSPGSLSVSGAISFSTLNGATATTPFTINGSATVSANSLSIGTGTVTVSGSFSVTGLITIGTSGTLNIYNSASGAISGGSFSMTGGTLNFGQSTSTVNIPIPSVSSISLTAGVINDYITTPRTLLAGVTYNDLFLRATSAATNATFSLSSTLNVTNLTVVGSAIFSPGANTVNIGKNFSATNTNFIPGTSTINFNGSVAQTISGVNFYNLQISNTSTNNITLSSGITGIANNLTVASGAENYIQTNTGTIDYNGVSNQSITTTFVYHTIKISNTGTGTKVTLPASPSLRFERDFTANQSFDALSNNATVEIIGNDVVQTIYGGTFYNLIVSVYGTGSSSIVIPTGSSNTVTVKNQMTIGVTSDPLTFSFIQPNSNLVFSNNSSLLDYNLHGNSFGGNVVFQRLATSATARKYFLSSPINGATVSDLQQGQTFGVLQYTADGFPGDFATAYSPCIRTGGNGITSQQGSASGLYKTAFGTLIAGKGYSLKQAAGSKTISYTGIPNYDPIDVTSFVNETVDRTIAPYYWCPDQNHLQLLGNPYPCAIDWEKVYSNSFGSLATYAKIYNGTTYTDLIYTGGSQLPIYLGQAFFVQVTDPGNVPSPLFDSTTWINDNSKNGTLLRKDYSILHAKLTLKDKNNTELYDELNLVLNDAAKDEIELEYDATDWRGEPEVPSLTAFQGGGEYSTMQFPTPLNAKKIPLVVDIEHASTYLLTTKLNNPLPNGLELVLVDKKLKKEYFLEKDNTLSLNLPKGTTANQYEIQYRTTGAETFDASSATTNSFTASSSNGTIIVDYNEIFNSGNISIYDLNGKLMTNKTNIVSGQGHYEFAGFNELNCFIIKFASENGVQTRKVIIK